MLNFHAVYFFNNLKFNNCEQEIKLKRELNYIKKIN